MCESRSAVIEHQTAWQQLLNTIKKKYAARIKINSLRGARMPSTKRVPQDLGKG
jgi:hypothetical protein